MGPAPLPFGILMFPPVFIQMSDTWQMTHPKVKNHPCLFSQFFGSFFLSFFLFLSLPLSLKFLPLSLKHRHTHLRFKGAKIITFWKKRGKSRTIDEKIKEELNIFLPKAQEALLCKVGVQIIVLCLLSHFHSACKTIICSTLLSPFLF